MVVEHNHSILSNLILTVSIKVKSKYFEHQRSKGKRHIYFNLTGNKAFFVVMFQADYCL